MVMNTKLRQVRKKEGNISNREADKKKTREERKKESQKKERKKERKKESGKCKENKRIMKGRKKF